MLTYETAQRKLATARDAGNGKPIANNTRLFDRMGRIAVRLHGTDVVTITPEGDYILDTGGWRTVTTKQRINEYAPCTVFSDRGTWYLSPRGGMDKRYVFADGCTVHADGTVTGAADETAVAAERKTRRAVMAYAKGYITALYAGEIGTPGPGDCWGCLMPGFGGAEHIHRHVEEKYYVPRLLLRALEHGASKAMKHDAACLLKLPGSAGVRMFAPDGGFIREQLQKAVRKHCLREIGLAA